MCMYENSYVSDCQNRCLSFEQDDFSPHMLKFVLLLPDDDVVKGLWHYRAFIKPPY